MPRRSKKYSSLYSRRKPRALAWDLPFASRSFARMVERSPSPVSLAKAAHSLFILWPVENDVVNTFRILVVDDNKSLAEALADVFEAKGYEPTLAFDGVQAIEKIKERHFDCVLMDIRMPRLSGVDAFKEMKKLAPSTPVILMTAYSVQGLIEEARSEGVLAILQKPVALQKILSIVDELKGISSLLIADAHPD